MKVNSYAHINSFGNYPSSDLVVQSVNVREKSLKDPVTRFKSKKSENFNFLNSFWKRLVLDPLSLSHNPNATITSITESEIGCIANDIQADVLSDVLSLPRNSAELLQALEESNKIFHEDYPYDFILEYKGERLGMLLLDKCINYAGEEKRIYRFNPHIKSFRGLY